LINWQKKTNLQMINCVTLTGRLCAAPEFKQTTGAMPIAKLSIAVDRKGRDQKETDFFDAVCFGKNADFACTYLQKGQLVGIVGSLKMRQYQAKDGSNRKVVEITVDKITPLEFKERTGDAPAPQRSIQTDDIEDPFA
jgi:single-strand DNA-binding protein